MIELLAQFAAREDGVLVSIDELNRIVRAGTHAQLAEKAAAQIVFVTVEYLAGLTRLLVGHLLGDDIDRSVGTVHLADNPNGVDYNLYEGRRQSGRVETVLLRGQVVVENAKFVGRYGQGKFIPANMYASGYENRN